MADNSAWAIGIYWPPIPAAIKCRLLLGRLGRRNVRVRLLMTWVFIFEISPNE